MFTFRKLVAAVVLPVALAYRRHPRACLPGRLRRLPLRANRLPAWPCRAADELRCFGFHPAAMSRLREPLERGARIVVELLLRDQKPVVAIDDDVGRAEPLTIAREIEQDAYEGRLSTVDHRRFGGTVRDVTNVRDTQGDELERSLDAFDASRPAEQADRRAQIDDVGMVERPREREVPVREGTGERGLLSGKCGIVDRYGALRRRAERFVRRTRLSGSRATAG